MAIKLRSFLIRALTTVVFLPLFYWVVKHLPEVYFFLFAAAVLLLATVEFRNLTRHAGGQFYLIPALLISLTLLTSRMITVIPFDLVILLGVVLVLLWSLLIDGSIDTAFSGSAHTLLGICYLAAPLSAMVALKHADVHPTAYAGLGADLIFTLFLVIWLGDSGAYIFGSLLGKHRLAPSISPKKSVEGAVFNVVFNVTGAVIAKVWFFHRLNWQDVLVIGLLVGSVGMLGDLVESMWKRKANIKDSAGIIPGHGGLLDRLDSFVLSAPLLYAYFRYFM